MAIITPPKCPHCISKHSPGELAPQYNTWGSWKWETRACHLPTPTTIHKHRVSSSFCKASEIYYNLLLLGCSLTTSMPAACSLPRDPFALFRFLFPYTSCPGIVLFLEALAPSTRLLSPQPRLPEVNLQSTSVWGRARKLGHTSQASFTVPSLSVPGMS